MMVETLDRGLRPVLWVGRSDLRADAKHAPVRFEAGSMGNSEAFDVSPQHRMFVGGWQAELNFGQPEVLVSAVHMVGMPGVTRRPASRVTYLHVLLERHEIIKTAGTWSESYFPGSASNGTRMRSGARCRRNSRRWPPTCARRRWPGRM
jgi:hypothetical protein